MFAVVAAYGVKLSSPQHLVDDAYLMQMKQFIFDTWPAKYSDLVLEDKETKLEYRYSQRCHFPSPPSDQLCKD